MRLGIYGGSFNPVHYGHLLLAESCREQAALDEVWFMPAATQPHKQGAPMAPAKLRIEMLEVAMAGHPSFHVSSAEIDRGGISYTIDTLQAIRAERPTDDLFLLMGADVLHDLPKWREPRGILEIALPIAVVRHGSPPPDHEVLRPLMTPERWEASAKLQVDMPVVEFSSKDVRERVGQGKSIRYRTPRAVEKLIETNGLYK